MSLFKTVSGLGLMPRVMAVTLLALAGGLPLCGQEPGPQAAVTRKLFTVLDRPEVLKIVFHPRREKEPALDGPAGRTLRIPMDDGTVIGGRLYAGESQVPVILLFHGNGEIASDYDKLGAVYNRCGISLMVVDYRGYGISEGTPTATALIADADTIYRAARLVLGKQGVAPRKVFIMGRSLGSAAALEVASQAGGDIAGVIIESGFGETFTVFGRGGGPAFEGADEARDGFGNLEKIAQLKVPVLIIHGEADTLIPVEHAKALFQCCGAEGKRLVTIPGAGHNNLLGIGRQTYFQALSQFVSGEKAIPAAQR